MKPGLLTTEFWLAVLTDVGIVAAALSGNLSPHWAALASAVSTAAYALARGIAKTALPVTTVVPAAAVPPPAPAAVPPPA